MNSVAYIIPAIPGELFAKFQTSFCADPKLTKADFDAEPWQQALEAAKEPTCFESCGPLKAKIDQSKAAGQGRTAQIYTLFHAVASLCPFVCVLGCSAMKCNVLRPCLAVAAIIPAPPNPLSADNLNQK